MRELKKTHQIKIEFLEDNGETKSVKCTKIIEYENKMDKPRTLDILESLNEIVKKQPELRKLDIKAYIQEIYVSRKKND